MATTYESDLIHEESRIGPKIYRRSLNSSVWNKLVPKEPWQNGLSNSQQVLTVERNLPDNVDTWTKMNVDGSCIPAHDVIPNGHTLRSFELEEKAIESTDICVKDTRNAFQVAEQLKAAYQNLLEVNRYIWKRKAMVSYSEISQNKVVAAPGLPHASADFPAIPAQFQLNQNMLNEFYQALIEESAEFDGGSLGMQDSRPQFILVTDAVSSDKVMRETSNINSFLWNKAEVPELLKPLGVERGFRGFYHTIEKLPQRYEFVGGAYVEVEPYETVAATHGTKRVISAAYRRAPYTKSVIYLPSVMSFTVPNPISTQGSGTQWNPQTYVGDAKWMNIIDRATNPYGTIGFYRMVMAIGVKPVMPQFGYVIMHLRCPDDLAGTGCAESHPDTSDFSGWGGSDSFLV